MRFVPILAFTMLLASCSVKEAPPSASSSVPAQPGAPAPPPTIVAAPVAADEFDANRTRDPFAPQAPGTRPPKDDQIARKAKRFSLDELKLVGVVTGTDTPRAMLVDPRGKGWVVTRGDHVGRAEGERRVGWRVEKIREGDVVFERHDAATPDRAPETRVLALRTEKPKGALEELDD